MVKKNIDMNQSKLGIVRLDSNVPLDHIARFVVDFIEENYEELNIEDGEKERGRASFPAQTMLKLLVYSTMDHITSARVISDMVRYHDIYKYVCDGLTPSKRSIQRYRKKYGRYYNQLLKMTLKKASDEGFTEFNHVAIDGTIKKAYNSKNNVINKKETQILIEYFNGSHIPEENLNKLHRPARLILEKENISIDEKLELLYDIETQFTLTGQNTIPVNDIEARWMNNKKKVKEISYNIQSAVDYDTKLICGLNVVQEPTDHYQLPLIADKAIENIDKKPEFISADTIYLNPTSLTYFLNNKINGLIPNIKQSKEKIGKLNKNQYHKDHFQYIEKIDVFKCPENQYMHFQGEYKTPNKDPSKEEKIVRLYSNYNACKYCKMINKCISSSSTHRTITENGNKLQKAMITKMENPEYQEEYSKRSCVEGPFGTLKEQYNIERLVVIGKKETEERLILDAVAYNLKRLYNITHEKQNNKEDIINFCETMSITNQLTLEVKIY